jgi:hypothetical protein
MSSLACKNVKIQDSSGTVVSTISWDGNNVTFDKPVLVPTAAAGANNTQVATTAFAHGTLSANTNGYQKLPSGLIIQWGTLTTVVGSVTFPVTFPNACLGASATYSATASQSGKASAPMVLSINASTLVIGANDYNSVSQTGTYWLAIGY